MSDDPVFLDIPDPEEGSGRPRKRPKRAKEPKRTPIPQLPGTDVALTGDEVRKGTSDDAKTVAKLRMAGVSFPEIAELVGLPDARAARRMFMATLAATYEPEQLETHRALAISRAEEQFRRSFAMAGADFLVDKDSDERFPNVEKLRWHQQASVDLMNLATITGAKAPVRHEITPGEEMMERLVEEMLQRSGHEDIVDADVIELDVLEDGDPYAEDE